MPKNNKKRKNFRPKACVLQYADASLEQKYGRVIKELGCMNFQVELLDKQERVATLPRGTARRAGSRLKVGMLVLVQPLGTDIYGKQEIVTVYNKVFEKQLQDEGKLAVVKEDETKDDTGFIFEGEETTKDHEFDEADIDIDDI